MDKNIWYLLDLKITFAAAITWPFGMFRNSISPLVRLKSVKYLNRDSDMSIVTEDSSVSLNIKTRCGRYNRQVNKQTDISDIMSKRHWTDAILQWKVDRQCTLQNRLKHYGLFTLTIKCFSQIQDAHCLVDITPLLKLGFLLKKFPFAQSV
jgi:hypothetical protein